MSQASDSSRVLQSMLERLLAAIMTGPAINCRPHQSRQRIDLHGLNHLGSTPPESVLAELLSDNAESSIAATNTAPASAREGAASRFGRPRKTSAAGSAPAQAPEEAAKVKAWNNQQSILNKLRLIATESQTYEQDTGVDVLHLGFPLISIPPGVPGPDGQPSTRRILAPVAFLPIAIEIQSTARTTVHLCCTHDDIDRVQPNEALLAWIEQCTGKRPEVPFTDEEGAAPWTEICALVRAVCASLHVPIDPIFAADLPPAAIPLIATPRNDELGEQPRLVCSAVLGLFPAANQGLLRDTRELAAESQLPPSIHPFVRRDQPAPLKPQEPPAALPSPSRLISPCDPCQAESVSMARTCPVLVIHGPPGSGKSQTITNIIGDHLARGERVLFVCDKRTAVDVVANRLESLGLGSLCAVVHDPQKDQKSLYLAVRTQLEGLVDATTAAASVKKLAAVDAQLETLYAELGEYHRGLMLSSDGTDASLSDLIGNWVSLRTLSDLATPADVPDVKRVTLAQLEAAGIALTELFERATSIDYPNCPWRSAAQGSVESFLATPPQTIAHSLDRAAEAAAAADTLRPVSPCPSPHGVPPSQVARLRRELAERAAKLIATTSPQTRRLWAEKPAAAWQPAHRNLAPFCAAADEIASTTLNPILTATIATVHPTASTLPTAIATLEAYLQSAAAWWGLLAWGRKSAAAKVLAPLGMSLSPSSAAESLAHLKSVRTSLTLNAAISSATGAATAATDPQQTVATFRQHFAILEVLTATSAAPETQACLPALLAALRDERPSPLEAAANHADALARLETAARESPFIRPKWIQSTLESAFTAATAAAAFASLRDSSDHIDECLRIEAALSKLDEPLAGIARALADAGATASESLRTLRRGTLHAEILRRLEASPTLRTLDARRIDTIFARVRELESSQQELCRDAIVHLWTSKCRDRLLAGTQSRLNSDGAAVKQRLFVKGSKAMRLRQVIAMGVRTPGGDTLLDLRPVWMASPETVAQIFPREAIFDAVIFDEASQVRLEEALPVLARGKRIIIAGDPKQLPPTRFFESASSADSGVEGAESDAELFEQVQSETEDLLSAALSLDVHQSYLDVHYRSQNADLIEFSNHNFYASRLQAIPGHPNRRATLPPLSLTNIDGTYEDRTNEAEARAVVALVRELLERTDPPSIGIGCFNIAQRDLISELLDEAAEQDAQFGAKLAEARNRRSSKSFEGLFVKNLENVQGDERDHIIISTTYGPDPTGKFYRRFGPLAQPGGGRRLNVLVTRARQQVHIMTSIPRSAYRALPPVPADASPGGAWLLFAYLKFAEDLAATYAQDALPEAARPPAELVSTQQTSTKSQLAEAVAAHLAAHHQCESTVYWGNEGFCIDISTTGPSGGGTAPIGLLTDFTRFKLAGDSVKWDIFRTGILQQQGWEIRRIWSPNLLRDPDRTLAGLITPAKAT